MPGMTERNIRSVNLNLLLAFDALMAERNVTRAAQHNGLSQPAMSKALNRLRHLLDDRLFELRDGRMEPTPRALELAGPIHGALSDISRTLKLPKAFEPGEAAGAVRIATIDLHQSTLLPALVAQLRRDAPGLDLHFQAIERHRLHDQLATGELDLAIAPILAGARDLRAEPLWRDRLVTLIGVNNPLPLPMTLELVRRGGPRSGRRACSGRRERQGDQSSRCDPGRAWPHPTHRGGAAEFRRPAVRGCEDRSYRHFAQPD